MTCACAQPRHWRCCYIKTRQGETVATVLAVIYGVGHIYLGQVRRGVAILIISIGLSMTAYPGYLALQYIAETGLQAISSTMIINVSLIAAGLGSFGFWVWQIFNARKLAKQQQAIEAK